MEDGCDPEGRGVTRSDDKRCAGEQPIWFGADRDHSRRDGVVITCEGQAPQRQYLLGCETTVQIFFFYYLAQLSICISSPIFWSCFPLSTRVVRSEKQQFFFCEKSASAGIRASNLFNFRSGSSSCCFPGVVWE